MNRVYIFLLSLLALGVILPGSDARAQTIRDTTSIATGLRTPWEIIYGPDGWIWMTERRGEVSRVNPATKEIVSILSLNAITEVYEDGDAGLLGMALHPNFQDSAHVFLVYNYTTSSQQLAQKVVRYTYNGSKLVDPRVIVQDIFASRSLNSGRIIATPDRKLIYAPATAELGHLADRFNSLNGKILRMNFDGSVPDDNPFKTLPAPYNLIWTRGHRNTLGLTMTAGGRVYQTEENDWDVDPDNEDTDEVNIITGGRNYGYPKLEGSQETEEQEQYVLDSSIVLPIRLFRPTQLLAGIEHYPGTGDSASPEWANSLLITTLKGEDLRVVKLSADGLTAESVESYYKRTWGRLRDVAVAPDGRIFLATSNRDGFGSIRPGDDRIVMLSGHQPTTGQSMVSVTVPDGVRDPGDRISVTVGTQGQFLAGNQFIVQLSDANGSFEPKTVGGVTYPAELGKATGLVGRAINVRIPCEVPTGTGYRIRAVSTTPPDTTADNGTDISIVATVPTFTTNGRDMTVDGSYISYQWRRDGEVIPGASSNTYTAEVDGRYSVTVRTPDDCLVTSAETEIKSTGVDDVETGNGALSITPHPVRDHAVISLDLTTGGKMEITVRDIRGVTVSRIEDQATAGTYRREISTDGLPAGTYFITLTVGGKSWQVRMLKD